MNHQAFISYQIWSRMISENMLKLFTKKLESIKNSQLNPVQSKQPILCSAASNIKNEPIRNHTNYVNNNPQPLASSKNEEAQKKLIDNSVRVNKLQGINTKPQMAGQKISNKYQNIPEKDKPLIQYQQKPSEKAIKSLRQGTQTKQIRNEDKKQVRATEIKDLSILNILKFPVKLNKALQSQSNQAINAQSILKKRDEDKKMPQKISPTINKEQFQTIETQRQPLNKKINEDEKNYISLQRFFDDNYEQVNYNRRHNIVQKRICKQTQILINENTRAKKTKEKSQQKYRQDLIQIDSDPQQQIIIEAVPPTQTPGQEQKGQVKLRQESNKNVDKLPYVYMVNNLISLYGKVPGKLIKLYIKQLAKKHDLPFNKVLIYYGIQQMIHQFYKTHQIQCSLYERYVFSKLEELLPQFVSLIGISNWFIIRRIAQGLSNRFGIRQFYNDEWLMSVIRKKKKMLKEGGVDLQLTLSMAKSIQAAAMNKVQEEPSPDQAKNMGYISLKEYLANNNQQHMVELDESDEEILDCSEKSGVSSKLRYYKKLVSIQTIQPQSNPVQISQKPQQAKKGQHSEIVIEPLPIEIVKIRCKIPLNVQILSKYEQPQTQQLEDSDLQTQNKRDRKQDKIEEKIRREKYQSNRSLVNNLLFLNPTRVVKTAQQFISEARQKQTTLGQKNYERNSSKYSKQNLYRVRKTLPQVSKQIKQAIICKQNKSERQLESESEDKLINKMDKILYQFFRRQPDFTMKALLKQISRTLTQDLKVAENLHYQITNEWFRRYKKQELDNT